METRYIGIIAVVLLLASCGGEDGPAGFISDGSGHLDGSHYADGLDVAEPKKDVSGTPEVKKDWQPQPKDVEKDFGSGPVPGGTCESASDCYNAPCVPTPTGLQCSMICEDDCGGAAGWVCYPQVGQWMPGLCLQPGYFNCQACNSDVDCIEEWSSAHFTCVDYPNGSMFCADDCEEDGECPAGYKCAASDFQGEALAGKYCVSQDGQCPCDEFHEGGKSTCLNTNEFGSCPGDMTCTETGFECNAAVASEEACNGEDDNCDGQIDEDLGMKSCGIGECFHEVPACDGGFPAFCNPAEGSSDEKCDGLDNNCNGETDDFWPEVGEPCDSPEDPDLCKMGKFACTEDGEGVVCAGDGGEVGDEVCDGVDNDCDGQIDEGLGTSSCGLGVCAKTVDNCLDGSPQECDPMDGAEDEDLPDIEGVDSNCDGGDGDKTLAIFVDVVSGDDDIGNGTADNPLQSIGAGADLALATNKKQIYVSKGTYPEPFYVVEGLSFYGAFDASQGWTRSAFNATIAGVGNPVLECEGVSDVVVDGFKFYGDDAAGSEESAYAAFFTSCSAIVLANCTIEGGDAGDGVGGISGQPGAAGGSGWDGTAGCEYGGGGWCGNCGQPSGGSAGTSGCGAAGGVGGVGGQKDKGGQSGTAGSGGTPGGSGGATAGSSGSGGGNGANVADGAHGNKSEWEGTFASGGFTASPGPKGASGQKGQGGGGGGGGGGATQNCATYGASGGGGGAGGCAGTGGTGGTGGGGAFGLYLVNSQVTLDNTKVFAGAGGSGGDGGEGGKGGKAGIGGIGASGSITDDEGSGGHGGEGSKGGNGGDGMGGPGGPSMAIVCIDGSLVTEEGNTFISNGTQGWGGSAAGDGYSGHNGPTAAMYGCD